MRMLLVPCSLEELADQRVESTLIPLLRLPDALDEPELQRVPRVAPTRGQDGIARGDVGVGDGKGVHNQADKRVDPAADPVGVRGEEAASCPATSHQPFCQAWFRYRATRGGIPSLLQERDTL